MKQTTTLIFFLASMSIFTQKDLNVEQTTKKNSIGFAYGLGNNMSFSSEVIYRRFFEKFNLKLSLEAINENSPTSFKPTVVKINPDNSFEGLSYSSISNRAVVKLGIGKTYRMNNVSFLGELDGLFSVKQHKWSSDLSTYVFDSTELSYKPDDFSFHDPKHSYESKSRYYAGVSGSIGLMIDLGNKFFFITQATVNYFIEFSSKITESHYFDNIAPTDNYHNEFISHPNLALKIGVNYKF